MNLLQQYFGKDFDRLFVGFDDQFNRISKLQDELSKSVPNYPPYNIKKVDENRYVIEMAVAGFSKSELDIEFVEDKLIVRGKVKEDDKSTYLFNGLANRAFTRTFALNDQIEIKGAALVNGLLQIALERIIPDHKKPRKIDLSDEPSTISEFSAMNAPAFNPELLLEGQEGKIKK